MANAVDKFGKLIVSAQRDRAIEFHDRLAQGRWKSPAIAQLQTELASLSERDRDIVRRCVIAAVDRGIHGFLFALQEAHDLGQDIQIMVDGENVAALSAGLHGETGGADGWIAKFGLYPAAGERAPGPSSKEG
jgi:hypothetical protein